MDKSSRHCVVFFQETSALYWNKMWNTAEGLSCSRVCQIEILVILICFSIWLTSNVSIFCIQAECSANVNVIYDFKCSTKLRMCVFIFRFMTNINFVLNGSVNTICSHKYIGWCPKISKPIKFNPPYWDSDSCYMKIRQCEFFVLGWFPL